MRKVLQPNTNSGDRKYPPPLPTNNFEHGVIKDVPASDIPLGALADAFNVSPYPTEVQGPTGSLLYTIDTIPPIKGRSGYSASKTGDIITATLSIFTEDDVGNYWVWPTGLNDEIIEYISATQVKVANTGDISMQIGNYLRGKNNGWFFHEQLKRFCFQFGKEFYHSGVKILGFSRALIVSREVPNNVQSGYSSFDDYNNVWFNSRGIFKVNMETEPAIAYKINTSVPNIAITPIPEKAESNFSYRHKYSCSRLDGNQNIRDRLMPIKIESETGSNQEDQATNAAGLDKIWTQNAISETNSQIIGQLWIPSVVGPETTDYEWLFTHYTIYRTLDVQNSYARLGELDNAGSGEFNNPERFVFAKDLRVMGAFYAKKGGGIVTALVGEFEIADVGSILEWDNGDRDEIVAYIDSTHVRHRGAIDRYYEQGYTKAACIGNGRVMRATQTGDIITRSHGSVFSIQDVRKTLQWSDGYRSYVVGFISANQVRVHEKFNREVQGLTLDPRYRYYNDTVTDSQLRSRLTTLLLRSRFWRALPNSNGGVLAPGFMVTYQRNDNVVNYSQMPENYEYLAGYHNPSIQLTKTIKDDVQFMWLFPDRIVAWTTGKTYYSPTNSPGEFITPDVGEVVATIPGFEVLDGDKGLFDRGSIAEIGNGNVQLLTSEPDRVALRQFNGTSYSDDKAFDAGLGQGRMSKDLQEIQHATASLYTPEGHYIWGRNKEFGNQINRSGRSVSEEAEGGGGGIRSSTAEFADYTFLAGADGGAAVVPVECELETLYSTDYHDVGFGGWVVFKVSLIAGKTYRLAVETKFTQPAFSGVDAWLVYWKPSVWPGETNGPWNETYSDTGDEDIIPYWGPYPYKLNFLFAGDWVGGRRVEFVAEETGEYVFMFLFEGAS